MINNIGDVGQDGAALWIIQEWIKATRHSLNGIINEAIGESE